MNPYLNGLVESRAQLAATLQEMVDRAGASGQDMSGEQVAEARTIQSQIRAYDERISVFADAQRANDDHAELMARVGVADTRRAEREERQAVVDETLGARFVGSPEFREYQGRGTSARFLDDIETRAPLLTSGMPLVKQRVEIGLPTDLFPLFGVIATETISTGSFEYVTTTFTNNAAVVAEGAVKPESTMTQTLVPGALDTLAHWTQISRQALEDDSRIQSLINGKLTLGIQRKVHDAVATAITGAAGVGTAVDPVLLNAIRKAVGVVQAAGWNPNAVLLNPADWAAMDIVVMNNANQPPGVTRTFWGMVPVASNNVPAGTAFVGDYSEATTLFIRSGIGIYVTDSHDVTFTKNIFTILAEQRAKAVTVNPTAICKTSATLREGEESSEPESSGAGGSSSPSTAKR